jgi:hypothetical protein
MLNFTNIRIDELTLFFNQYGKPLFLDCEICGRAGQADYVLSRTNKDGYRFLSYVCSPCAEQWREDCKRYGVHYNVEQLTLFDIDEYYVQSNHKWTIDDAYRTLFYGD